MTWQGHWHVMKPDVVNSSVPRDRKCHHGKDKRLCWLLDCFLIDGNDSILHPYPDPHPTPGWPLGGLSTLVIPQGFGNRVTWREGVDLVSQKLWDGMLLPPAWLQPWSRVSSKLGDGMMTQGFSPLCSLSLFPSLKSYISRVTCGWKVNQRPVLQPCHQKWPCSFFLSCPYALWYFHLGANRAFSVNSKKSM